LGNGIDKKFISFIIRDVLEWNLLGRVCVATIVGINLILYVFQLAPWLEKMQGEESLIGLGERGACNRNALEGNIFQRKEGKDFFLIC